MIRIQEGGLQKTCMDKDLKEAIDHEQLRLVMQQVPTMQAASVVVALVLSYAARDFVSRGNILFFVLSISAVAASRVILYKRYLKACTKPFVATNWKSAYLLLALISGIVWGGSAFLILPEGNAWLLALFVLVMASLSASTTVSHSSIKWAPAAFMVPAMLLYAVHCILESGEQITILAFLIVLYLVVMLQYSIKHHGTVTSSIALRFEKLKLLEESRQVSERMRVILDSTDDGILAVDGSGKAIFSNRRFSELWRIPPSLADTGDDDAMLEFVLEQLVDPDAFLRKVKQLYATADLGNDIILFKDGRIFERHSTPMMNNNSVIGRLWSFRDITDRKRAEEELRLSRQLLALHVQQTPLAVVQFDLEGRVREWNPAATNVFGYSPEEAIGQHWTFLVPESTWGQLAGVWEGLVSRRGGSRSTNENRTKDGRRINCEWFNTTLADPDGKSVGVASLVMDVTERERAEREKEKLQAQLQQAIKMEAVGRLAGGVAHDFNNLLMVITGYSDLLLQKIGNESPMRREVEEIKRAGERAASLTQQLLAFSRKQIIEPKVLHLDLLVAEMHKMLTRLIGEDIALQATTGKSLGSVKVDPGQFQQILMNLVVNARDAMRDGGMIMIETANVDLDEEYCALHHYVKPGRFVMLSVSDTGHGMSEEVKKHIFEPFFTTKEKGKGTGLGLATTYGAVKQAGGSIEVSSEVGIGTTFKIYLPRVEEEATKPGNEDRPTDLPGGTETVLLVEDEGSVRNLCARILERLGYKVLQGSNAAEAISVAQKHVDRIDLLLTDVVMPGMNGRELASQLVLHHPEMKVLFMSGYTDDAIARRGILDEGTLFIGKPYSPSVLAKRIRDVLDQVG